MMAKSIVSRSAAVLAAVAALLGSAASTGVHAERFRPLAGSDATQKFRESSCCSKWCCRGAPLKTWEVERDVKQMQSEGELKLYRENVEKVARDYRCCGKLYTIFGSLALGGCPALLWSVGRCCCWSDHYNEYVYGFLEFAPPLTIFCGITGITLLSCGGCMCCNATDMEEYVDLLDSPAVRAHVAPRFFGDAGAACGGALGLLGLALLAGLVVCVISGLLGKNTKLNRFRPEDQMLVVDTAPGHADVWDGAAHGQRRLPGSGRATLRGFPGSARASRAESGMYTNPILDAQLALGRRPLLADEVVEDFADDLESVSEFEGH